MNPVVSFFSQALADALNWMAVTLGTVLHVLTLAVNHADVTLPALGVLAAAVLAVRVVRRQRAGRK